MIKNKIIPVVCIGETLEEKEKKITKDVLLNQINESIPAISNNQNTIIAYEPIWAIGTGLTPTLDDIDEDHSYIRNIDYTKGSGKEHVQDSLFNLADEKDY